MPYLWHRVSCQVGQFRRAALRGSTADDLGRLHKQDAGRSRAQSLGDEASGPVVQLLAIPEDPGDPDDDADGVTPFDALQGDIASARGKAILLETTAAGFGEGRGAAPQKDWVANRLGPNPPPTMPEISRLAFGQMLAACGSSACICSNPIADGTSQREMQATRRWFMLTVRSLRRPAAAGN